MEDMDTITSIPLRPVATTTTTTAPNSVVPSTAHTNHRRRHDNGVDRSNSTATSTTVTTTTTTVTSVSAAPSSLSTSSSSFATATATTSTTNTTDHPHHHPNRNRRSHHLLQAQPLQPHQAQPPRRGRSHSMAVDTKHSNSGRAWNHHQRRRRITKEEEVDRLGERILELLFRRCDTLRRSRRYSPSSSSSSSPSSSSYYYNNTNSNTHNIQLHFQWKKPILCHHNWMVLQRHWKNMTQTSVLSSFLISSAPKHTHRTIGAATTVTRHAVVFWILSSFVTTTMTAVLGTGVILLTTWLLFVLLLTSLDVLFDLPQNTFFQHCVVQRLQSFYTIVDRYLFQGRRYTGRTLWYTTNSHHPTSTYQKYLLGPYFYRYTQHRPNHDTTTTTSTATTMNIFTPLHQLNIPASLSNTAKTTTHQRQNHPWSDSTTKHLQAMHYCYVVQKQYRTATTTCPYRTVQIIHSDHNATEVLERDNDTNVSRENDHETGRTAGITRPLPSGTDTVVMRRQEDEEVEGSGSSTTDPIVESTTTNADLAWIDVGAQIGLRLLHSEHVQRAMALQDTKERILETMNANHNNNHKSLASGGSGSTTAHTTTNVDTTTLSPSRNRTSVMHHSNSTSAHHGLVTTLQTSNSMDTSMTTSPTTANAVNRGTSSISKIPPKPIHTMWTSPGSAAITNHHHQHSRDRHPAPPALAPHSPIDPNENEPTTSASLHHTYHNHHYDDHVDHDNFLIRQSQSYPISPCSSPRALLTLSSIQLPPLQSPSATTTTNNNNIKEQSNTDGQTTTIQRDRISRGPLPDLPLTSTKCETEETSIHAPSVYSNNATSNDIARSKPRRLLSSHTHYGNEHTTSRVGHSFKQQGRVHCHRRVPLLAGMKVAVPMSPYQPHHKVVSATALKLSPSKVSYMMSTVVRSQRIYVDTTNRSTDHQSGAISVFEHDFTNCLSVTVKLDKFFLRHGEFGELTFRVLDEWSTRYMPRHSKVPIGACVATSYGIGVLVGWRVEDDSHIVRSLWQCRGSGSAYAYMNRHSIHKAVVAANGFRVQTVYGWGIVQACVKGGTAFTSCRYFVEIREEKSRHKGNVLELDETMILSCHGAQFMPVIEHVRAAALYQIQMDNYNASLREQQLLRGENSAEKEEQEFLRNWSACADILWNSFLKAVEEDKDFDEGVHDFVQSMIDFLDRLDKNDDQSNVEAQNESNESLRSKLTQQLAVQDVTSDEIEIEFHSTGTDSSLGQHSNATHEPGFWFMNDLFGGIFKANNNTDTNTANEVVSEVAVNDSDDHSNNEEHKTEYDNDIPVIKKKKSYFKRAFAVLRTIMKTVSIARASSVDHPHFRLALAISYDVLLFLRTILKIQQRNTSVESLKVWKRAWGEIIATFGPIQERLESIGQGIANRMERQGRKAKVRVLKFVDTILGDERLLFAMEQGEWDRCLARVEIALVEAEVIEEKNLIYYRKAATFIYDHVQMLLRNNEGAAARNNEKLAILGHLIQSMAAPRRSILKIFCREDILELFERILVRAYYKEEVATRMLTIHAATFHSLRHLRILKDFSVSGRIWIPLLDAADEELSWFVSNLPENSQGIMLPVSRLFSLCVAQFHKINDGDLSKDWLAFLLEEESVQIIQEIDMLLILGLESFSRDIREMMTVLPYYASIDDDILNLMDEVNLDEFLKEAASAIDNPDKLAEYIREKATIAIERFLNYLPKMSIPVEKRELGDGWVLSCHGSDGGGLTLTDVTIRRENLVCQIMGGDTLFFPMFNDNNENLYHDSNTESFPVPTESLSSCNANTQCDIAEEESILDHIRILLLNAQKYGCWKVGFGGICQSPSDPYAASILRDIPISNVLNCSIELWRNLQIDDDALLEIAIRDISYHIQLQKRQDEAEETNPEAEKVDEFHHAIHPSLSESTSTTQVQHHNTSRYNNYSHSAIPQRLSSSSSFDGPTTASSQNQHQHRFNPRVDPTVLFLEIKRLTLNLDNFFFRIEKAADKKTIFDPVFAGRGMLSLQNISIRLRVECAKERVKQPAGVGVGGQHSVDIVTPILQLRQLEVSLEKLSMIVKDTGFGSDWILNKAVEVFEEKLTEVVVTNLKDQIQEQLVHNILESLNSYFLINPNLLLNVLGISMDDLDENVVWV